MLFTTPTQWAALAITLIAGWLLGFASHSGGKKWKRALEQAELDHAAARERDDQELRTAHTRIRDLEREIAARPAPAAAPAPTPTLGPIVMPSHTGPAAPEAVAPTPAQEEVASGDTDAQFPAAAHTADAATDTAADAGGADQAASGASDNADASVTHEAEPAHSH